MKNPVITMSTFGSNGRFGNQIFQYAFLKIYAQEHNLQVEIPKWKLGEYLFGHDDPEITKVLPEVRELSQEIAESQLINASPPLKNLDIWGYFQYHTNYYAQYKEYFRQLFQPRLEIQNKIKPNLELLRSKGKTIVGVHIRLTDYGFLYCFIAPIIWYKQLLTEIWHQLDNPVLYIASDEPERVLPYFPEYNPVTAKDLNIELPDADFYPDFYILSQCDVVAISNSTFSFAACMLNQRGQQFFRPHLPSQKLIAFDPWNSDPIFRDAKVAPFEPRDLDTLRQQICDRWLSLNNLEQIKMTYLGGVGTDQKKLLKLGITDEPLTQKEKQFIAHIAANLSSQIDPSKLQYLLVALLYRRSYQLPGMNQVEAWNSIPEWFFDDFLEYVFDGPRYFTEIGEVHRYSQYIKQLINAIHRQIFETDRQTHHLNHQYWEKVAVKIANNLYRIPLWFQDSDFRSLASQQTDIIEFAVKKQGHQVDYKFPDRPADRSKIRLGILQTNFGHQSETLANLPIIEEINRDRFEVILYGMELAPHPVETYCKRHVKQLVHLPEELEYRVARIRQDHLDILLIGSNATGRSKNIELLVLHRLARVQVTHSVSLLTSGMRHIDYYITGNLTAPLPTAQQHYTEELINISGAGLCFKYPLTLPKAKLSPHRSDWGAAEKTIVFISGANFYKIIPELRETWAKIIRAVPNSMLVLYPFSPNWNKKYPVRSFTQQMKAVFTRYDLNPDRVFLCSQLPSQADVNACLELADIYLDAYPYTGALSLLAPLQVGLPVVVREGQTLRSRRGAAIIQEMQQQSLITHSEAAYIQLAVELANDSVKRKTLKQQLQDKFCQIPPFLDSRVYAAQIGKMLERFVVALPSHPRI